MISTSHYPVATFQQHQRMEFTFHNSYIILELVPSTLIFWTELRCWGKSYSNEVTLVLSHEVIDMKSHSEPMIDRFEISTSQMTMDNFPFKQIYFFPLSPIRLLPQLCMSYTTVFYKKPGLLIIREHMSSPRILFLVGSMLLIILVFYVLSFVLFVFVLCLKRGSNVPRLSGLSIDDCIVGFLLHLLTVPSVFPFLKLYTT